MTPDKVGYEACVVCGVLRPLSALKATEVIGARQCKDVLVCANLKEGRNP